MTVRGKARAKFVPYTEDCTRPRTVAEAAARWRLSSRELAIAKECAQALADMQAWQIEAKGAGRGQRLEELYGPKPAVPADIVTEFIEARGYQDPADATKAQVRLLNAAIDIANHTTSFSTGAYSNAKRNRRAG